MKKVVALKDYSDNYYILREGMIYNLIDSIADQLIEKEICAVSTGSPDDVAVVPSVTSGTEIADIKINGQSNKIYTPASNGGSTTEPLEITITYDNDSGTFSANKTYENFHQEWVYALDDVSATVDLNKISVPCTITYNDEDSDGSFTTVYNGLVAKTPQAEANDGQGLALVKAIESMVTNSDESVYEYHLITQGFIFYQHEADDIIIEIGG